VTIFETGVNSINFITVLAGSGNLTIITPLLTGTTNIGSHNVVLSSGYTGAVVINGNCQGGARGANLRVLSGAAPSSITVNGNVVGAQTGGSGCPGMLIESGTVVDIYGDVIGGLVGGYALRPNAPNLTVRVHGVVRGGTAAVNTNSFGIEGGSSCNNDTTFIEVLGGEVTGTAGGIGISIWYGQLTVPDTEFRANGNVAIGASFAYPVRISGTMYVAGYDTTTTLAGQLPVGLFQVIEGESLDIYVLDDANFPTNMQGTPVLLTTGSSGTNVPVDGNATEIEARADGTIFSISETDPDMVVLTLPGSLSSADIPEMVEQLNDVFAPPSDPPSGWMTVVLSGIQAFADTSDVGGEPDTIPMSGTVTLTPGLSRPIRQISTRDFFAVAPTVAAFDGDGDLAYAGSKGVRLVAPEWTDLTNTSWRWTAEVRPGPGQTWDAFSVTFTGAPGETVNLADLV
jgi:hypothetical protein